MTDYSVLFRELAVPRLVGTPNHERVREILKRELGARGFVVEEHAFAGSSARALLRVAGVVHGINLIAQRRDVPPSVWLVAHYDSKGQPISMALRLAGVTALVLALLVIVPVTPAGVVMFLLALLILTQNRVNNDSPGAVDNATALVTVLMTIDQLNGRPDVGVIFPDAEELGLVGARALANERADLFADSSVINLDGLDDAGRPSAFLHRRGSVSAAVAAALQARQWRWLPVIVDGIALSRVARECVTILKGNWRTMRVVHRPADDAARVRLDGAATVAAGLARVLRAQ